MRISGLRRELVGHKRICIGPIFIFFFFFSLHLLTSRLRRTDSKQTVQSAPIVISMSEMSSIKLKCVPAVRQKLPPQKKTASDFSSPLRMLTGSGRLTLTDGRRLQESGEGRASLNASADDYRRLIALPCRDKRMLDGDQINGVFLSVKVQQLFNL